MSERREACDLRAISGIGTSCCDIPSTLRRAHYQFLLRAIVFVITFVLRRQCPLAPYCRSSGGNGRVGDTILARVTDSKSLSFDISSEIPHRSNLLRTGTHCLLGGELLGHREQAERIFLARSGLSGGRRRTDAHPGLISASRCVLSGLVPERHRAGRQPMANSKTIAGLIGPFLIALAAALLINLGA
jgi:hypothetical protein